MRAELAFQVNTLTVGVSSAPLQPWVLYIVQAGDGSLYTGITTDLERRLDEHRNNTRRGARALRGKLPLRLVYTWPFPDRASASQAEYRVKRLSRAGKLQLVAGELEMQAVLSD